MITQNPIVGRSKNKLAGVYARTLWGMNIIQSCPKPRTSQPTPAMQAARTSFANVMAMANQLTQGLLNELYYAAPIGRSRRHVLASQLMQAVQRNNGLVTYDPARIEQLGTNLVALTSPIAVTPTETTISINVADIATTESAIFENAPLTLALNYELCICYNLLPLSNMNNGVLTISPIPSTWIGQQFFLFPLFQVNMGTTNNPVYAFGRYEANFSL